MTTRSITWQRAMLELNGIYKAREAFEKYSGPTETLSMIRELNDVIVVATGKAYIEFSEEEIETIIHEEIERVISRLEDEYELRMV